MGFATYICLFVCLLNVCVCVFLCPFLSVHVLVMKEVSVTWYRFPVHFISRPLQVSLSLTVESLVVEFVLLV